MVYGKNFKRVRGKYDKRSLINAYTLDTCLIFDIADGGSLVCSRACSNIGNGRITCGTLFDIMSDKEVEFLFSYCRSYTNIPAAVNTKYGIAILYPHLVPASSCCVLSIPGMGGEAYTLALMRTGNPLILSDEVSSILHRRKVIKEDCLERCNLLMESTSGVFDGSELSVDGEGMTAAVADRIHEISRYAGCYAGVICGESLNSAVQFDNPLFISFTLILLCIARGVSARRDAGVALEQTQYGAVITVSFAASDRVKLEELESFAACRRIADRRNLLFEIMVSDSVVHIRFSPVRREWSYLELKSPDER